MEDYAGRVLADRYRLPLPPSDEFELAETRAFDTYSGHEVLVRQVPLPEVVDAEVLDGDGLAGAAAPRRAPGRATRRPSDPAVLRAVEAAQAAARIPDHPRLDQVFDVFAEDGSLWIVSEVVDARPLAALLAERPLSPYRAAEVAADVLAALRVLHAHGWTHRNITVRTVLVCEDGRVVLTGLASGAAEEALCGYAPVPEDPDAAPGTPAPEQGFGPTPDGRDPGHGHGRETDPGGRPVPGRLPAARTGTEHLADETHGGGSGAGELAPARQPLLPAPVRPAGTGGPPALPRQGAEGAGQVPDVRAARAGAIAAYRAGARAAARIQDEQRSGSVPAVERPSAGGRPVQDGVDPDWWAQDPAERYAAVYDDDAEDDAYGDAYDGHEGDRPDHADRPDHDDDPQDGRDRPRGGDGGQEPGRARLAGVWRDTPPSGHDGPAPLPAGGGRPALPAARPAADSAPGDAYRDDPYGVRQAAADRDAGRGGPGRPALPPARAAGGGSPGSWTTGSDALRADSQRGRPLPGSAGPAPQPPGRWEEVVAAAPAAVFRGPTTPLAAERARQARIAVVGAVTERWAPEQAGPVHDNWQLAAPVGPATDLWALGALLYRAVQGHAPYPEDSAHELVQMVCSEPPAFAEECGPLRPVVESLLRQDPTERPEFEELSGWLRSLVRSAPEPEAGADVVPVPSGPVDPALLPIVRRRGELVRRRRFGGREAAHGRHRQKKSRGAARPAREERAPMPRAREERPPMPRAREERPPVPRARDERLPRGAGDRAPRALGRTLLVLILLLLAAAVAYAFLFMPKADEQGPSQGAGTGSRPPAEASPRPSGGGGEPSPEGTPGSRQPQTSAPAADLPDGYVLREDIEGFRLAVDRTWQRRPINDAGQVRWVGGDFTLIVVPGRDSVAANGDDPLTYQRDKERELQPFRDSSWASATGLRRIDVGKQSMAEGQFTWQDSTGREVFVRNLALIVDGAYHVVQVIGPADQKEKVTEIHQQATSTYRVTR
ncbi:protein kinase [Streptomyces genisteinicus]|uniref:Protein kinase n=1 Tax=Streptomyces genisteinicus TaxID=2768068 RepID=A0A7H0HWA0_9ACTN|nr:protein kinase [Streptomyces genisteinicus]QNP64816.1 protein kinase [Streptomyces genisteinicus]